MLGRRMLFVNILYYICSIFRPFVELTAIWCESFWTQRWAQTFSSSKWFSAKKSSIFCRQANNYASIQSTERSFFFLPFENVQTFKAYLTVFFTAAQEMAIHLYYIITFRCWNVIFICILSIFSEQFFNSWISCARALVDSQHTCIHLN